MFNTTEAISYSKRMNQTYPIKNLPVPLQGLIRPMLFMSIALHGLLMLAPVPDEEAPQKKETEKPVKITQLPTTTTPPTTKRSQPSPKPAPPKVVTPITRQPVLANRPRPQPIVQAPRSRQQPTSNPSPASSPVAATPTQTPTASPAPTTNTALTEFPIFPGAKAGCLEVQSCFQTGNTIDKVAAYFEKELPARKFTAPIDIDEADRKVYQVSGTDFPAQYLSLISTEQGTIYVLADQPRTLDDLKNAVVVPPEFYTILAEVGEELENESPFANPNDFYTKLESQDTDGSLIPAEQREEIEGVKLVPDQAADAVYNIMLPSLQSIFEISQSSSYSGGPLYKLKKDSFTGYLNLVPTKDGTGTIVVLWSEPPA